MLQGEFMLLGSTVGRYYMWSTISIAQGASGFRHICSVMVHKLEMVY